jgi:hypothetical protein
MAAREHTELAMNTLISCCKDARAPWASRVTAASTLLDRGWGKARQDVNIEGEVDVRSLANADLDAALRTELGRALGLTGAGDAKPQGSRKPH